MSFGQFISEARKKAGLSQKELASRIQKEDGTSISPQYLNDIEHGRRNPPPAYLIHQLADELKLSGEQLLFMAGEYPNDIRDLQESTSPPEPEQVEAAFKAFRRALRREDE
jgi:transcriptional regulator with XRE-family HTH domain